jgi:aspartate/glutamate racemase
MIAAPVQLGQRRVDHAPRAELLLEAQRHLEGATVDAHVLADHEYPVVTAHLLAEAVRDRLQIRLLGHLS